MEGIVMDRETQVRRYRAAVLKDIRKQIKWITDAVVMDDQTWIDIYADQLAASVLNFKSEVMNESLQLEETK